MNRKYIRLYLCTMLCTYYLSCETLLETALRVWIRFNQNERQCRYSKSRCWLIFLSSILWYIWCWHQNSTSFVIEWTLWSMHHPWFSTRKASKLTFICFQLQLLNTRLNNWSWKQTNVSVEAFLVEIQGWLVLYPKSIFRLIRPFHVHLKTDKVDF
jgi:hypothetical protein